MLDLTILIKGITHNKLGIVRTLRGGGGPLLSQIALVMRGGSYFISFNILY